MIIRPITLFATATGVVTAAAFSQQRPSSSRRTTALTSYLESLGDGSSSSATMKPASYGISGASYNTPIQSSSGSVQQVASGGTVVSTPSSENDETTDEFPFAPASYFSMEHLVSKGPRPTADWGTPGDATRKLCDDGTFRAGAWYCSEGGWPSPNEKAATEIFYVVEGHGSLDDADGVRHYFGPGDNVIIPKGHTGRWDVNQPIRKVWAVNAHANIEERGTPIRVQVDHYNSWSPDLLTRNTDGNDPLYGFISSDASTISSSKTFYDVGPTQVGAWFSEPGSYLVSSGNRAWIYILEGVVYVTNGMNGSARRCVAGDTIVLPAGWHGNVDVIETTKKLWTVAK